MTDKQTVDSIPDNELLRRFVSQIAREKSRLKRPMWSRISDATTLGSTYSAQLCERFGYDPDETKPQLGVIVK